MNKLLIASSLVVFGTAEAGIYTQKALYTKAECSYMKKYSSLKNILKLHDNLIKKAEVKRQLEILNKRRNPYSYINMDYIDEKVLASDFAAEIAELYVSGCSNVSALKPNTITITVKSPPKIKYKTKHATITATVNKHHRYTATINHTNYIRTTTTLTPVVNYEISSESIAAISLLLLLTGGGVYMYKSSNLKRKEDELDADREGLNREIDKLKADIELLESQKVSIEKQLIEDKSFIEAQLTEAQNNCRNLNSVRNQDNETNSDAITNLKWKLHQTETELESCKDKLRNLEIREEAVKEFEDSKQTIINNYENQIKVLKDTNPYANHIDRMRRVCAKYNLNFHTGDRRNAKDEPCIYMHIAMNGAAYVGKSDNPRKRWGVGGNTSDELSKYNPDFLQNMYLNGGPSQIKTIWATGEALIDGAFYGDGQKALDDRNKALDHNNNLVSKFMHNEITAKELGEQQLPVPRLEDIKTIPADSNRIMQIESELIALGNYTREGLNRKR